MMVRKNAMIRFQTKKLPYSYRVARPLNKVYFFNEPMYVFRFSLNGGTLGLSLLNIKVINPMMEVLNAKVAIAEVPDTASSNETTLPGVSHMYQRKKPINKLMIATPSTVGFDFIFISLKFSLPFIILFNFLRFIINNSLQNRNCFKI